MAWVKIPAEHHPIFLAALPSDPRVSTLQMFGGIAAKVNGHMMAGLFGRSAMVRLSTADQQAALALDGAAPFDPMGTNRPMTDSVLLPEDVMDDRSVLRDWLSRALAYTATLPPKAGRKPKPARGATAVPAPSSKPAAKPRPAGAAAQPRATAKPKPAAAQPRATAKPKPAAAQPRAKAKSKPKPGSAKRRAS